MFQLYNDEAGPKEMSILVTGCEGYIAPFVIQNILDETGFSVIGIDIKDQKLYFGERYTFIKCDIRDRKSVENVFRSNKIECVFHFAALISVHLSFQETQEYHETNVIGTQNIISAVRNFKCDRFVFASTCAVYDSTIESVKESSSINPLSPYACQKDACENIIRSGMGDSSYIIFRFFNVAGRRGKMKSDPESKALIPSIIRSVRDEMRPIIFGNSYPTRDGTTIRDYIHPHDIARAFVCVLEDSSCWNNCYNLGSGNGSTTREVVETVIQCMKDNGEDVPEEIDYQPPRIETVSAYACCDKFNKKCGWEPAYSLRGIINSML